ncbi:MAG: bifunctional pyr operon transcriptional regulator/uracil phosphoribosyltransferase PyrR [Gammaproteobacteria bacterium]|nr:bifunctional pyr operon transcriptional regulator/uracil phosphoribosyltransferase PyrR [Gammaproteobacteria bacterium]MCW8982799.1 bifunctional pyr operon transcriptional regulator/uracil phosphoribosyltransferase PyrR [Gammaproteobacteria bacterium]
MSIDPNRLIEKMAQQLRQELSDELLAEAVMIGIHTGGVWVAEQLHQQLNLTNPLGLLDINFYRDDFSQGGLHPQVRPSTLPVDLENKTIILVDDVLQSGRTIRAALNEIFDYGRPDRVILAILVERSGRELPIQADVIGEVVELQDDEQIKLTGPEPLELKVVKK